MSTEPPEGHVRGHKEAGYMATINSGITMRILPLTQFGFTGIGASKNIAFPIGQHIEAGVFTEADMLVRLHTGTQMSAGQSLSVTLSQDGYDFEDPANVNRPGISGDRIA
jgi:hypothetical protein